MKPGRLERREIQRRELRKSFNEAISRGDLCTAQHFQSLVIDHDLRTAEIIQYQKAKTLRADELVRIPIVPGFANLEDAVKLELPRIKDTSRPRGEVKHERPSLTTRRRSR